MSTAEQNEVRQQEALAARGIKKWFVEKTSAKDTARPEYQKMLDWVREGDTIYMHDLSRIVRSTKDLLDTLEAKGVALVSDKESIDTGTATGKLIVTVIAAINEFKRGNLLERQREGIAIVKRNGVYKGRKEIAIPDIGCRYERYARRFRSSSFLAIAITNRTTDRANSAAVTGGGSSIPAIPRIGPLQLCRACRIIPYLRYPVFSYKAVLASARKIVKTIPRGLL